MKIMTMLMQVRKRRMKRRSNLTELAPEADIHVVTPF